MHLGRRVFSEEIMIMKDTWGQEIYMFFFFSSRRRHTRLQGDWSSDVCSSDLQWTELHEQIGALPDEEREVVGLLFYQGLSQAETAEVLGISLRTVQRRWHDALDRKSVV